MKLVGVVTRRGQKKFKNPPPQAVPLLQVKEDKKRRQPKIFHLSDCIEITDKNMLKMSNRIGCNDSPFSQVDQQTESMTEKFFERALFPRLFQLNCDQRESRKAGSEKSSLGFGDGVPRKAGECPKYNKITNRAHIK